MKFQLTRNRLVGLVVLIVSIITTALVVDRNETDTASVISTKPEAKAEIKGGPLAPDLKGIVEFRRFGDGTLVSVRVEGLPKYQPGNPPIGPFGFHIHELGNCEVGDPSNPFQGAGGHWNPYGQPHGNHAGDLPVLFSNSGKAVMDVYTDKFKPGDVIGRSIMIHQNPDDFRTQPAGASGLRLACGVIKPDR